MILNLFGLLVVIYNLFLIDTICQLFANQSGKREVYYDLLYYHNKFNTFFNHFIIGIAFPVIVLLCIMHWIFVIFLYFILTKIIFKISTFIFDKNVFPMMLNRCIKNKKVVAVGCVEQINRGAARTAWRFSSRLLKHHYRRLKISFGLRSRAPKPYREVYLKSFCTLWNCKLVKQHGMHFLMDDRVPGYTLQDRMIELGYVIESLSPRKIFSYLDHIQSGTVAAAGGYGETHRRTRMYNNILKRLNKFNSND